METSLRTLFAKLNGENYFTWKYKMEMYLRKEKLWTVISDEKPVIPEQAASGAADAEVTAANAAIAAARVTLNTYLEKDETARATIGLCVEDSQLVHIRNTASAKAAWEALRNYHERNTLVNKVTIMRRICGIKLSEIGDMEKHIGELTDLFQKLVDLGENQLNENWRVAITLSSLPPSYDHLVTALEARPDADLTLSLIHSKLIAEYHKRKDTNGESSQSDEQKVLKTAQKLQCFFCKKSNHIKKDCFKYKKWLKKQSNDSNTSMQSSKKDKVNTVQDEFMFTVSERSAKYDDSWLIDSGATSHITSNRRLLNTFDANIQSKLTVANNTKESVNGKGSCKISFVNNDGDTATGKLTNVLYAPQIQGNMISVNKLTESGYKLIFDGKSCDISLQNKSVAVADKVDGLYKLRQCDKVNVCTSEKERKCCIHEWHRLFGHRNADAIKTMFNNGLVDGAKLVECGHKELCETCSKAKLTRFPFPKKSQTQSKAVLDLIHSDVCGPMRTESLGKKYYFLTMIDDFSRYTVIYFLRHKSEVEEKIKEFVAMAKNQFGRAPKILRTDGGGEYIAKSLKAFLNSEGIKTQKTAAYSPQQNGVAERKNRTLVESARCMLTDADLPNYLWAEAVNTANYIQNRITTKGAENIPYFLWNGNKPRVDHFEMFGTKCYVHIPKEKRHKLQNTATQMLFVGYDSEAKAFRCFDPVKRNVVISRDVRFHRNEIHTGNVTVDLSTTVRNQQSFENHELIHDSEKSTDGDDTIVGERFDYRNVHKDNSSSDETSSDDSGETVIDRLVDLDTSLDSEYGELSTSFHDLSIEESDTTANESDFSEYQPSSVETDDENSNESPRRSARTARPPDRYQANLIFEPKNLSEVLSDDNKPKWIEAMKRELGSMQKNDTWELCDLPHGRKAIGSKWIFKTKTDEHGNPVQNKARLVAQGFSQKFGTDYDQVFAPVARQTTFRILLSVASKQKMIVHHLDVETAFLNGKLHETIYMRQPPGFECSDKSKVCRLKKAIYGLKQAAKSWNDEIHRVLTEQNFEQSKADPCLYTKKINGEWVYILIYVDDITVAAKSVESVNAVKAMLQSNFSIKDLGAIKHYLGIEITRDKQGIFYMNQGKYINKIVNNFGMTNAKASNVPMGMSYGKQSTSKESLLLSNEKYRSLVGCLLYISVNTRPDISASIAILGQKVSKPSQEDWNELKRVLKYLKGTAHLKLALGNSQFNGELLFGYSDANFAEDKHDRKSNSGHVFLVNGATVCWSSRKQSMVSLSTCEAEFIALSEACRAASWVRRLLTDMKQRIKGPTTIYEDNQSCLKLIEEEERLSERSKHIDTRFYFIKDYIVKGLIYAKYCPTEKMLADALTKPLPAAKFETFRNQFGIVKSHD